MGRNLIESLERLALIGLTAGSLNACAAESQRNQLSTPTPAPKLTTEIPKIKGESDIEILLRVLGRLAESSPAGTRIKVEDYGSERHSARVVAQDGVKLRMLPDTDAPTARYVKWPRYGQVISFRYAVVKEVQENLTERWLVLDEQYDDLVRWQCLQDFPAGTGRCFAAAQIGDEALIAMLPQRNLTK